MKQTALGAIVLTIVLLVTATLLIAVNNTTAMHKQVSEPLNMTTNVTKNVTKSATASIVSPASTAAPIAAPTATAV